MLEAHTASLAAFDASEEAKPVLITPGEVLALHKIRLEFGWLTEWSPAYFPTMRDPGLLDVNGKPTNPCYQPGAGKEALRSYGVPHPSAGMPVGDLLRDQRVSSRAHNPTQRAAYGPANLRCPAGVPFPEHRPPPKKKPKVGQWGWSRRPKKCADDSDDETLESMKARAFAAL